MTYDFSVCKLCGTSCTAPRYRVREGILIYCCSQCGGHYINHLDNIQSDIAEGDSNHSDFVLSKTDFDYLDKQLQSNVERFRSKVNLLLKHCPTGEVKVLDIGAGGGLFLHLLKERGIDVYGIEPNPVRIRYAREKYELNLSRRLADDSYWQNGYSEFFDVVTLWDVIEHVNFPTETLKNIWSLLKDDGLLLLDTPARDAFYYRLGEFSYRFTFGVFPLFLNMMYSKEVFAHKQIFSSSQLTRLLRECGFRIVFLEKIHELSFPYSFYIKRLFDSARIARATERFASHFFNLFKIRNKMIMVGQKMNV